MKRSYSWITFLLLGSLLIFFACGDEATNPAEESAGEEELSLDKEFGGYETGDESAAFGEASLLSDFPEDEAVADGFSQDAATMDALTETESAIKAYFVRITWGLLEGDSTATEQVDFSGFAEVSKGALALLKTVRFERNDMIVLPRDNRQRLDFVSTIKTHFDGLLLAVIDNDTTDSEDGTLTITAGAYSKTLNFADLDSLELMEPISGDYEASIIARSKDVHPFAGGFISGHWLKNRRSGGIFRGRWINSLGANAGYLRGIWGVNRAGERVFKGKYISLNGRFRGLLAGHWDYDRDDNTGVFRGHWVNRQRQAVGTVHGRFKTRSQDSRHGFFQGRYKVGRPDRAEGSAEGRATDRAQDRN